MKNGFFCALALGTLSGLLLGFSQPFYMPNIFGAVSSLQWLFGLLALVAYVPLFWELRTASLKKSFWLCFYTITIQYIIVLYWIYIAVHDYGDVAVLPALVITLLLPFLLAFKGAVFFTFGRFISMHFACSFFILAPIALCALEYFRNYYIFGGFPWGNVGYSIGRITEFRQFASIAGVYGLVFLVGLVNALICILIEQKAAKQRALIVTILLGLIILWYGFGVWRLKSGEHEWAKNIKVALLQANIPQEMKNRSRLYRDQILEQYLELQRKAQSEGAELVIWPESAHPYIFEENVQALGFAVHDHIPAVVGAMSYGFMPGESSYYHNSAFLLDYLGRVVHRYDKTHLVPFGEYVPWPLNGVVKKIVPGMGSFHPGLSFEPQMLAIAPNKEISVGTTICYEGIFPEISRTYARRGATLLVNLTNDAWYGKSSAPYQHLLMYQLRSVETGRPYLRATNSGLSAWIDIYGRAHQELGLFESGLQIANVPLLTKNTIYDRIGDLVPIICLLLLIAGFVLAAVPLKKIWQERQYRNMLILAALLSLPTLSYFYYSQAKFLAIEAASTKKFFIFLLCMTILFGALSKSRRSRKILFGCAIAVTIISLGLAIFESAYFLFGIVLAVLIFLLALASKKDSEI